MNTNRSPALDILYEAENARKEGCRRICELLPLDPTSKIAHILVERGDEPRHQRLISLLNEVSQIIGEHRVQRNITDWPFANFWANPDEPRHSKLLRYFIDPAQEHRCGLFLLRKFLSTLQIIDTKLPVDEQCKVTCEDQDIDLLITRNCSDGKYAVFIENKVNGARDQPKQLQRYYDKLLRRDFKDEDIFPCYLTLRDGKPSEDSAGGIRNRVKLRTFEHDIVRWLKAVLRDNDTWPVNMLEGMCDNLKHYLNLINWRLNNEKVMQKNEKLFEALKRADREKQLPTFEDISALKESVLALEECYGRMMRAKMLSTVLLLLKEQYGLVPNVAYHSSYPNSQVAEFSEWNDDLLSREYWFGVSVGSVVIVAVGEDWIGGIFTGYGRPQLKTEEVKLFETFVKDKEPLAFSGKTSDNWYSYFYEQINGSRPEDAARLAAKVKEMHQRMVFMVAKFRELPRRQV